MSRLARSLLLLLLPILSAGWLVWSHLWLEGERSRWVRLLKSEVGPRIQDVTLPPELRLRPDTPRCLVNPQRLSQREILPGAAGGFPWPSARGVLSLGYGYDDFPLYPWVKRNVTEHVDAAVVLRKGVFFGGMVEGRDPLRETLLMEKRVNMKAVGDALAYSALVIWVIWIAGRLRRRFVLTKGTPA